VFSATNTISCLAEVFDAAGALPKLESFASLNGPRFYGLEPNADKITLRRGDPIEYPATIQTQDGPVTLFDPGFPLHWRVEG
jgi:dihydroorotase